MSAIIVVHPCGVWTFDPTAFPASNADASYGLAYAAAIGHCDDISEMYDLNEAGTPKSRATILHPEL